MDVKENNCFNLKGTATNSVNFMCRLCMSTEETSTKVSIFKPADVKYLMLNEMIEECTSILMTQDDGMPCDICQACADKIIDWYNFKQLAKSSEEILRRRSLIKQESYETFVADLVCDVATGESSSGEENLPLIHLAKSAGEPKKRTIARKVRKEQTLKRKPYCKLCGAKFLKFNELSEHCLSEHNVTSEQQEEDASVETFVVYRCHVCQEEFSDRKKLRSHCKDTHNIKVIQPYGCSHCPRQFPSWNPLVVHERQHTGDKPYSCDVCGKTKFISLTSLRRHKLMHDKVFHCAECGRDFNCDSALKAHIRCKHTKEKPFLCTICGRSFSLIGTLSAHMTSHSSERKYSCDICGFRSKTSGNHHRHMARHNKPTGKIFSCSTCGKAFETKLQLSSHSVIHKSDRPHVCKLCGKGFIYKNKMETHILLVHAKERPYPCKICGRKLATKFGLKIHLKTHLKSEGVAKYDAEDVKIFNAPQLLVEVSSAPVLTVDGGNNLVLEEVKAGLLCFKPIP